MALVSDLVAVGIPSYWADKIGFDIFPLTAIGDGLNAGGTALDYADATAIPPQYSLIPVTSSAGNVGVKLPSLRQSKSGLILIQNLSNSRDLHVIPFSADESFISSVAYIRVDDFVINNGGALFFKVNETQWGWVNGTPLFFA